MRPTNGAALQSGAATPTNRRNGPWCPALGRASAAQAGCGRALANGGPRSGDADNCWPESRHLYEGWRALAPAWSRPARAACRAPRHCRAPRCPAVCPPSPAILCHQGAAKPRDAGPLPASSVPPAASYVPPTRSQPDTRYRRNRRAAALHLACRALSGPARGST